MPVYLSKKDMSDLLVTAWEGGSNYWIEHADYVPPKGMSIENLRALAWEAAPPEEHELWRREGPKGRWPLYAFLPLLPPSVKWKIKFKPIEDEPAVFLTPENMREAAPKLVDTHPKIFGRIKSGDFDAGDADAWLQTAVFDEIIFG